MDLFLIVLNLIFMYFNIHCTLKEAIRMVKLTLCCAHVMLKLCFCP